jgi:hypothetical protein
VVSSGFDDPISIERFSKRADDTDWGKYNEGIIDIATATDKIKALFLSHLIPIYCTPPQFNHTN